MDLIVKLALQIIHIVLGILYGLDNILAFLGNGMEKKILSDKDKSFFTLKGFMAKMSYYVFYFPEIILGKIHSKVKIFSGNLFKLILNLFYFSLLVMFKYTLMLDDNFVYRIITIPMIGLSYFKWAQSHILQVSNIYLTYFLVFIYSISPILYPYLRYAIIEFLCLNFKNKELFRSFYTLLIFISVNYTRSKFILIVSSLSLLMLTVVESKSLQPPAFFKKFIHYVLKNKHRGGRDILNQLLSSKYSFYVKCNPCQTPITRASVECTGHIVARLQSNYNKVDQGTRFYSINENNVKVILYNCDEKEIGGKSVDFNVMLIVSGVVNETFLKEGDSRSVRNLLDCLEWYSENPNSGIYKEEGYNHCLSFQEIIDSLLLSKMDFVVRENYVTIENYGTDEIEVLDYLTKVCNYKAKLIKTLFYHNESFFGSLKPTVLCNLLNHKAAIGEKNLGSSVYKKYCSEVNFFLSKITGKENNIKMVKKRPNSEKFESFLKNVENSGGFKNLKGEIKVKVSLKDTKKDLRKRLEMMGRCQKNGSEDLIFGFEGKESETVVCKPKRVGLEIKEDYDIKNKPLVNVKFSEQKTFASILKESLECDDFKQIMVGNKQNVINVPKLVEFKIKKQVGEKNNDPLEVFKKCSRKMRSRDIERINDFISKNDLSLPENTATLKRYLWNTRVINKADFIEPLYEEVIESNIEDIEKIKKMNEKITADCLKFDKETDNLISSLNKASKILGNTFKEVNYKRSMKVNEKSAEQNNNEITLTNYYSCLEDHREDVNIFPDNKAEGLNGKDVEIKPSKSVKQLLVAKEIEKIGAVSLSKNALGKNFTKSLFDCSGIDKKTFCSDFKKSNYISDRFSRVFDNVLSFNVKVKNEKVINVISEKEDWFKNKVVLKLNGNQLIRRIKLLGVHLKRRDQGLEENYNTFRNNEEPPVRNEELICVKRSDFPELEKFKELIMGVRDTFIKTSDLTSKLKEQLKYFIFI